MSAIPAVLLWILKNVVIPAAVKFGVPWVIQHFPWIPVNIQSILDQLVADLENNPKAAHPAIKALALAQVKQVGKQSDPK